ncbi:tRNA methyltransferase 10 homolog C [Pseudophryne corroboree]|uniref:tRNA methyltransferase 10 homolog C n=1 Tax=Pseudophryne corroboree TaxID=495146 RepID=UPI003081CC61
MITFTCKMGFMNTCIRTLRGSTLHSIKDVIKPFPSKLSVQRSPCRTLMLSQCWRNQDKSSPNENIDLDTWKDILRSGMPRTSSENTDSQIEEESSLESMQKLVEMWRMAGKAVPNSISTEELQVLQGLNTKSSRRKYLKDLVFKEYRKMSRERKKLVKEELQNNMENNTETDNVEEEKTVKRPTYLLKFLTKCVECYEGWRGAQAMIFGQPLVFDMVYDHYMSHKEMKDTVGQLMMSEGFNKKSADPFHIHFCNLKPNGPYQNELVKRYQGAWDDVLVTSSEKSHIDIFPSDQLVYLTSDSPNVLKKFDHDKIYIVGAFVDRSQKTGVSLGNAKRLGIATARLPLDRFLKWSVGAKNLTLNQMIEILMILKDTEDWTKALSVVPERKHLGFLKESISSTKALSKNTHKYEMGKRKGDNQKEVHKDSPHHRKTNCWEERD